MTIRLVLNRLQVNISEIKTKIEKLKNAVDNIKSQKKQINLAIKSVNKNKNLLAKDNEEYYYNIQEYLEEYKLLKNNYDEKINAEKEKKSIENLKKEKKSQLNKLKYNKLSMLYNEKTEIKQNQQSATNELEEYYSSILELDESKKLNSDKIISNEIINTENTISETKLSTIDIKQDIKEINYIIENAEVTANNSGYVKLLVDNFAKGNFLYTGDNIMNILLNSEDFYIEAYIKNSEIGKLETNMPVKCEVETYPKEEYGYLKGKIKNISNATYDSYYKVIIQLESTKLYDENDKCYKLKEGMNCSINIISEKKTVIKYILEKLDLLDEK